ncbi:ROK family protein [Humibacter antri]
MAGPLALAIDIGGTKIAVGVVDEQGRLQVRGDVVTPAMEGSESILSDALRLAVELTAESRIAAIGVGSAGVIDRNGRVSSATGTLAAWAGADVAGAFRGAFGLPVRVVNDVHAHAVGEAVYGAGRAKATVLVVAAGTGVGGAIVTDGAPALGAHGAGGHLGHIPASAAAGLVCSCGRIGHLEAIAAGPAIHAAYQRAGGHVSVGDARAVVARVDTDPIAAEAVHVAATALGSAIGGLVNTVDPDVVVVAGGLSGAGDFWWDALLAAARADAMPSLASVPIVPAELGPDAALAGAAHLAFQELK